MTAERLSDALNDLDDGIIGETGRLREARKRRSGTWKRWTAAAAACLCVAAAVPAALAVLERLGRGAPTPELPGPGHIEPELLPLPLPELGGGYGFEAILLYDISELGGLSPWNGSMELTTLPVYENMYHPASFHMGLGEYTVLERLEEAARALDAEIMDLEYEWEDRVISQIPAAGPIIGQIPADTGAFGPFVCITAHADGMEIAACADGLITVSFEGGLPLPEGYRFTDGATDEEAEAALDYLAGRFSQLLGFSQPRAALSGEYDFDGTFHREYAVYDGGDSAEAILNHSFRRAEFFPDKDGNLAAVSLSDGLACARELGGYPIITAEEAKTLLLKGGYITSVPYEMPGEDCVAGVELAYRSSKTDEYFLPYYRFYVELPEEARDNGLKTYGVYYVPAVRERYIANMPVYDGGFH